MNKQDTKQKPTPVTIKRLSAKTLVQVRGGAIIHPAGDGAAKDPA